MTNPKALAHYEPTIGIESHVQLKTKSKLFCSCSNESRDEEPNTNICPICMGFPGTLPVLNEAAVKLVLRVGLALNGRIAKETKFDRKNYFYPDLPKGYQISQYDQPMISGGLVKVPFAPKDFAVGLVRVHLEEDTGKNIHPEGADYSLVDLNRAGTPLLEIVSEPDIHSAEQAKAYAQELAMIMRYGQVSDVDLYHGNMRFDVNVSVRKKGAKKLGIRTEIKNLNSFRSVEKAVDYEIRRQVESLEKGAKLAQETRGWDEAKSRTFVQRVKEYESDYRYFPEPDLPPLAITSQMVSEARQQLPALPSKIRNSLRKIGLDNQTINMLLANPVHVHQLLTLHINPTQVLGIAKYYTGRIRAYINKNPVSQVHIDPKLLVELFGMQAEGKLSSSAVDKVLDEIIETGKSPKVIAESKHLLQISAESEIEKFVARVLDENTKAIEDYKKGNEQSLQFLIGQVMGLSRGKANPQIARELLLKKLASQ
ncbi:Asp-tRNA(Asn)/Glu-tRNA(Gln) amidotransferase subunit GatB [Candidatus Microgenomates bacterium]|nr:Asp-tRNA(Asn)/Glu-tRNA(Gln) amidotransferase subunit GatB [Candidatus Microgenomates bacterium]